MQKLKPQFVCHFFVSVLKPYSVIAMLRCLWQYFDFNGSIFLKAQTKAKVFMHSTYIGYFWVCTCLIITKKNRLQNFYSQIPFLPVTVKINSCYESWNPSNLSGHFKTSLHHIIIIISVMHVLVEVEWSNLQTYAPPYDCQNNWYFDTWLKLQVADCTYMLLIELTQYFDTTFL